MQGATLSLRRKRGRLSGKVTNLPAGADGTEAGLAGGMARNFTMIGKFFMQARPSIAKIGVSKLAVQTMPTSAARAGGVPLSRGLLKTWLLAQKLVRGAALAQRRADEQ